MKAEEVSNFVVRQLRNNFALTDAEEAAVIDGGIDARAYNRALRSLTKIAERYSAKYYEPEINPLNTIAYCNYLYWLSREAYENGLIDVAAKVYYLNKMLNCVELFYEVALPEIWSCEHPLGSVMGRAKYGNYFRFYQGCTVGGNRKLKNQREGAVIDHPMIGENVMMYSNSKILGAARIGDNCIISANCYIKDDEIPSDSIVFGQHPNLLIKPIKHFAINV